MSVWMYKIFVRSVSIDQANFDAPRDGQVGKRILCKSITEQTVDCKTVDVHKGFAEQRFRNQP